MSPLLTLQIIIYRVTGACKLMGVTNHCLMVFSGHNNTASRYQLAGSGRVKSLVSAGRAGLAARNPIDWVLYYPIVCIYIAAQ